MVSFEAYFDRQIRLWGEETQRRLRNKTIAIIGCGGLGSSLATALGTSGIGKVHLVDFDEVGVHNIHRQIAFTIDDEGRNKAETVAALLRRKNPFVEVTAHTCDFAAFARKGVEADVILDATDNLPVRAEIDRYAKARQTPWIYGSVEAFNGQVCFFDKADFKVFTISDHKPGGIAAPMVMHIASLQANLALRYLAGLSVAKDKLFYLYVTDEGMPVMQTFGMPQA